MDKTDLEVNGFFTTNGKDIWKLKEYCLSPSCKLENVETKEVEDFGIGGLTSQRFHKINMPKTNHPNQQGK